MSLHSIYTKAVTCVVGVLVLAGPALGEVIYVDADRPGENGTSWSLAYKQLQRALDRAASGDEIWVAEATYRPDYEKFTDPVLGTVTWSRTSNPLATFQLKNGVSLYGGFAGTEDQRDQRDPAAHPTILSGDIRIVAQVAVNSFHVVTGSGTDNSALLDGFTIRDGNANDPLLQEVNGAGMFNNNGSPTLQNCVVADNSANGHGGGMYNVTSSAPVVTGCVFMRNTAGADGSGFGGGMSNRDSSPFVSDTRFTSNRAESSGGGMDTYNASPTLIHCDFAGNSAGDAGAGMYNHAGSSPYVIKCIYAGNSASSGAGMANSESNPFLVNCAFVGNHADTDGGGLDSAASSIPEVTNCTFGGNTSDAQGGGIHVDAESDIYVNNTILWANTNAGGSDASAQLHDSGGTDPDVAFSCIQDNDPDDGSVPFDTGTNGNIDDDPLHVVGPSGTWTDPSTYDDATDQTEFYDSAATFTTDQLVGSFLNADTSQGLQSLIVANTDTSITVLGQWADGVDYQVYTPRLTLESPCLDTADNDSLPPDDWDLDSDGDSTEVIPIDLQGGSRVNCDVVDMGALENQNDLDGDGVHDQCDNCVNVYNPGQEDADSNGIADACEGCTAIGARTCQWHDDGCGRMCLDLAVPPVNGDAALPLSNVEPRADRINDIEIDLDIALASTPAVVRVDCTHNDGALTDHLSDVASVSGTNPVRVQFDPALPDESACQIELDCGAVICVRGLRGDVDRNGAVTTGDASQMRFFFGESACGPGGPQWDYDQVYGVTTGDFSQIRFFFGAVAPICP